MIGLKRVVQEQVIEQCHQLWRQIDEAFLAFCKALCKCCVFEAGPSTYPDAIAMELEVLDEETKDLTDPESSLAHQEHNTTKLKIVINGMQKRFKVSIFDGFDAFLRLLEPDDAPGSLPTTRMNQKRLEPAEAIRDLLVEHRIGQRFATLNLVAVEAADGSD